LDKYLDIAGSAADMAVRAENYRKAQARVAEILPHIYLYRRVSVHAFRKQVKGWKENGYGIIDSVATWNIADWYIEK
jgi:ABC-type transport system substrate-binding protein